MKNCPSKRTGKTIVLIFLAVQLSWFAADAKLIYQTVEEIKIRNSDSLTVVQLKEDFAEFRQALEAEHPGLYRYTKKATVDKIFDSCLNELRNERSIFDFGATLQYIISSIRDGHTGINIGGKLIGSWMQTEKLFPLDIVFINNQAFVRCSKTLNVDAGSEIISINDITIGEIRKKLMEYLPSDGWIETKKMKTLNNGAFAFLYRLIYGKQNSFSIKYKNKQGEVSTTVSGPALFNEGMCNEPASIPVSNELRLEKLSPGNVLLRIGTFDNSRLNSGESFEDFLNHSFEKINKEKTQTLIIDIRGNGGGHDENGSLLYQYLAIKPFRYFDSIIAMSGKLEREDNPRLNLLEPKQNRFVGKVIFLIDGLCFSTTADFCAIAKNNKRGIFVGEETGGAYAGNTSGTKDKVILTHSQFTIFIPQHAYYNAVIPGKLEGRGVIPEYIVVPTIQDILKVNDVQLSKAINIARY